MISRRKRCRKSRIFCLAAKDQFPKESERDIKRMARALYLIFNHQITDLQRRDAIKSLGVERIVEMPTHLKHLWRNIPPDLPDIKGHITPVMEWLSTRAVQGDFALIQGDYGACYILVQFAFERGLVPIYSTTFREAIEECQEDGSITLKHVFRHCIYRRYGK